MSGANDELAKMLEDDMKNDLQEEVRNPLFNLFLCSDLYIPQSNNSILAKFHYRPICSTPSHNIS